MRRRILVLVGVLVLAGGLANGVPAPGPDAFGYTSSAIAPNLRNVSASGTFLSLSDDQMSGPIGLPFTFDFYGSSMNSVHVSSNGFLDFDGGDQGCCTGHALPLVDTHAGGIVSGFWEDLNAPQGNIRYQTLGPVGSREFVVGFYGVHHFPGGPQVTFEMILEEGTNNVELQYGAAPSDGGTHSVGIESPDETDGLQILLGNVSLNNQGFLITHPGAVPPPQVTPLSMVWAVQPSTRSILKVDPTTGAILGSFAAPAGLAPGQQIMGLTIAENGNALLYQNGGTNPTLLYRLDPDTGAVLSVETMNPSGQRGGLSFESGTPDSIFAIDDGAGIDLQAGYGGPLTKHLGPGPVFPGALGGDDAGRHFAYWQNRIVEFDPNTPNTVLSSFVSPGALTGLAFDGHFLFASDLSGNLFTLDPNSGAVLNIVSIPGGPVFGLGAHYVPEPGTVTLLALGGLGLLRRRRKR